LESWPYRRLLRQVRPYRLHIVGIFLLFLLDSPLALLTPLPLKLAVDSVVGSHHLPGLLALLPAGATRSHTAVLLLAAGLFVAITPASQLQNLASSVLSTYTGERLAGVSGAALRALEDHQQEGGRPGGRAGQRRARHRAA
jgi:ATP-binding cassette subfamily B protein